MKVYAVNNNVKIISSKQVLVTPNVGTKVGAAECGGVLCSNAESVYGGVIDNYIIAVLKNQQYFGKIFLKIALYFFTNSQKIYVIL